MRVIIMGCGRRGSTLAAMLDAEGHDVTVLDVDAAAFSFLPDDFGGTEIVGNGADEDSLRCAGIEQADAFVSTTRGDNRNVMAAQMAKHIFNVPRVITLVHDPIREEMYRSLGLRTVSPTLIVAHSLKEALLAEESALGGGVGGVEAAEGGNGG
ncbi:MAG TPA: TrkA family potassium uptake protein [Dehalococcoidia bacterium]|nr:TrkA family potassium uptake protein [Dehalococcoidia bacterium]